MTLYIVAVSTGGKRKKTKHNDSNVFKSVHMIGDISIWLNYLLRQCLAVWYIGYGVLK